MPIDGYFDVIFGSSGDLTAVPDPTQGDGSVSYTQGWPSGYALPLTNPSALPIDRAQTNQLFYDMTSAIQRYQQHGTPPFITTSMNGGSPFSYGIGDRVIYGGVVYTSLTAGNTSTPPSANWAQDFFHEVSNNTGYQTLPSGLIIQWQKTSVSGTTATVSLPISFPNVFFRPFCSLYGNTPVSGLSFCAEPSGLSSVLITASAALGFATGVNVLSIGY